MKKSLGPNPLVYPAPVWVIGTYNEDGSANIMTAAWGGICCSKPPCLAVSLREATQTHTNILRTKAFTVNIVTEQFLEEADYCGISTGRNTDKFADTGLTSERSTVVDAPMIKEFPLNLECRLKDVVEVGLHTQFIGEIIDVKALESILGEQDVPDVDLLHPVVFSPVVRKYHSLGETIGRAFDIGKKFRRKENK
ncbi:MAG: flavin reductase family protein [Desulfobulbaceae bacterium]|jgi:flavin reductase (DIM6/NTAB) family NADH-FMN oxidoreductase RutF|nr:flavin reductase family protein [Desulfobulbaceae bacterium]